MPLVAGRHSAYLEGRIGSLEGLRGVAILLVIGFHADTHFGGLFERGLGVNLFFAISGFLITSVLLREHDRTGAIDLGRFWARRALRTFPLYYAVLALYVVLVLALEPHTPAGRQFFDHLPFFLSHTANWLRDLDDGVHVIFAGSWSLSMQEQFYLFWGLALAFVRPRWLVGVAGALVVIFLMGGEAMAVAGWFSPHGWLAHIGTMKAETIFLGGAAALVAHHLGGFRALGAAVGHRWSSAALAAALVAGAMLGWHDGWLQLIGVALVVACAVRPEHLLRRLLESAPLRYLGTLSYALYLLHPMAIHGVRRLLPESTPQPLLLAVVLACSIAAAAIAHRVVEAPFLRIKEAISRRQKERTPLPASLGAARSPSTP